MKWLLLLVLVCAGAFAWWSWGETHPEIAACDRFSRLCGEGSRNRCDDSLDALLRTSGREALRPSIKCLRQASSLQSTSRNVSGSQPA